MKTNIELDRWAAETCGVKVIAGIINIDTLLIKGGKLPLDIWTLSDARCREIVREWLKIRTAPSYPNRFSARSFKVETVKPYVHIGKTIADAEIACIQAIKDAEGR